MFQHSKRFLNLARMQSYQPRTIASVSAFNQRAFSRVNHESESGLLESRFDYLGWQHKVDQGNFPHEYLSYMKVIGEDYDTKSA